MMWWLTRQVGPTKPSWQWHLNFEQVPSPQSSFLTHLCPPMARGWRGTVSVDDMKLSNRPWEKTKQKKHVGGEAKEEEREEEGGKEKEEKERKEEKEGEEIVEEKEREKE